jgi:isopenicillin-N N-acyltransferase like protein
MLPHFLPPVSRIWSIVLGFALLALLSASAAVAAEPRAFTERRSGGGELKYINDLPVLTVSGTPEEMGRQSAALTGEVVKKLVGYPEALLRQRSKPKAPYVAMCKKLAPQLSAAHREELLAALDQLGVDRDDGLLGNLLPDVYRGGFACSSLTIEPSRSGTKGLLFGRNLDFYTLGILDKYGLVTVRRPTGKHAFVTVGFPGMLGCLSGMNDAGLAVAVHEVFVTNDGAPIFNPKGEPYTFCFRRILEECTTAAEAEKLLRAAPRTTLLSLAVCDRRGGVVLEMTPRSVVPRHGDDGILACTNHFRTAELGVPLTTWCPRYQKLMESRKLERLDVADVAKKLDEARMTWLTVQTMVFEPATLKLHLAMGKCPSSALPLKLLDLKPLFTP